jgi:hypothetical protein
MTYHKPVPDIVFSRWKELNPDYTFDFSLDTDCIQFLKTHFNDYISNLFKEIPVGMFKADLWRLCKLYVHGGVYADVDLVPYLNIDTLDTSITFYSCLNTMSNGIFQAFMKTTPKNPLILVFLLSFLKNNPYTFENGPTYDMYNCIQYNTRTVKSETRYDVSEFKIRINFGSSETNTKEINLYYFPDIDYVTRLIKHQYNDTFQFQIRNHILYIKRLDAPLGWGHQHSVDIVFKSKESIFLFTEYCQFGKWSEGRVTLNNEKIFDCRDENYYNNKGW